MITIYGKDNCTFCDQAVQLCNMKGVEYEYIKLGDGISQDKLIDLLTEYDVTPRTMPQILDDFGYVGGFTELKRMLI